MNSMDFLFLEILYLIILCQGSSNFFFCKFYLTILNFIIFIYVFSFSLLILQILLYILWLSDSYFHGIPECGWMSLWFLWVSLGLFSFCLFVLFNFDVLVFVSSYYVTLYSSLLLLFYYYPIKDCSIGRIWMGGKVGRIWEEWSERSL